MAGPIPSPSELNPLVNRTNLVVKLYVNDVNLESQFSLADFVEANFNGYEAADPPPMPTPELFPENGRGIVQGGALTFTKAKGGPENTVKGYLLCLKSTVGLLLLGVYQFETPVKFIETGDTFTFAPTIEVLDFAGAPD